jgi:serine/threonine protein kinase
LFDCEKGVVEDIIIRDVRYSRIKVKPQFRKDAQEELDILISLQGAPLIPNKFGIKVQDDCLWILFERLAIKSERPLSDIELVSMLFDSVRTLRLLESRDIAFRPIRPQTCLFNENGSLKFLDISEGGSVLSSLFSSSKEILQEVILFFTSKDKKNFFMCPFRSLNHWSIGREEKKNLI